MKGLILAFALSVLCVKSLWAQNGVQSPVLGTIPTPVMTPTVDELQDEVDRYKQRLADMEEKLNRAMDQIEALKVQVRENDRRLISLAEETPNGTVVPRILANMNKDPDFRENVVNAVQGEVILKNTTDSWQRVYLNASRWRVPPSRSSTIRVPFGHLIAHTPGQRPVEFNSGDWKAEKINGSNEMVWRIRLRVGSPTKPYGE